MSFRSFLKQYGACLAAILLFISASLIYCYPALQGKVLSSEDKVNARCAARETYQYHKETGRVTWWCDSMFSGMPTYHIKGGQFKADRWLTPLTGILHKGQRNPIWAFLLYFFCFFLLARSLDLERWLSIIGAFALTLSSYFVVIIAAGHGTKTSAIALMSAVLAGFFLLFRKKYAAGVLVTLVFSAAGITVHPQMSYYILLLAGVLWLSFIPRSIKERRMKDFLVASGLFAACVAVGLMANASSVFVNAEYTGESVRGSQHELAGTGKADPTGSGESFITGFSYGRLESLSLLIPGVTGGISSMDVGVDSKYHKTLVAHRMDAKAARNASAHAPMYWGDQPLCEGDVYVGAVICFLFLLGVLAVRGGLKWGLLIATLFSIALALGRNFMPLTRLFLDHFPFYDKFRSVSSILVVAEIAMPLLGLLAVQGILSGEVTKDKAKRSILISAGITVGICLLSALLGPALFSFHPCLFPRLGPASSHR